MSDIPCPYRSLLYMPGSNARALEKARTLDVDALILDLEDAVAPDKKVKARDMVAAAVEGSGFGSRRILIRINGLDTEWGAEDLAMAARVKPDAILVPKVSGPEMLEPIRAAISDLERTRIWAMIETPMGVLRVSDIAAADGMAGFVMGTNDLLKEIGARWTPERVSMLQALSHCILAARAHGILCIDGVFNGFNDEEGTRAECVQGRDLGMDGKSLIHPKQIAVTHEVFSPSDEEIDVARRQVAAFAEAEAAGSGVAVLDGRIVENLHVAAAKTLLAKADAIASRKG